MPILAYHLTWTTYGTWLPGDRRGWVRRGVSGIQAPDPEREESASNLMAEAAIRLSVAQRAIVEKTITEHCRIRNWTLHAVNARSNHVHVVVTSDRDPDETMNQLKAWCSRKLSDDAGLTEPVAMKAGRRHWFTEGGDKEIIEDEEYLENAIRYVIEGQGTPPQASPPQGSPPRQQGREDDHRDALAGASGSPRNMIRITLPFHLRTLAGIAESEVALDVPPPVTQRSVLDALEARYPQLRGTIRDHGTLQRRPFLRYFVCNEDASLDSPDAPLPAAVAAGAEPFMIVGAIAGG